MSTTNIVVDRAKKNVRTLFPPFLILLFVDSPHQSGCLLVRFCPWRLVMPLMQRGGQPILLWRRHMCRLRQWPSGLSQRLRHYLLSSHPPKWIPLPLHQPPCLPIDQPLPSPVVWCLLFMLRILSKGGGGGAVARWQGDDNVRMLALARCCRRRGEDATINIRWDVGGGSVTKGGFEVVAVRGGSRCRRPTIHCASADHCPTLPLQRRIAAGGPRPT